MALLDFLFGSRDKLQKVPTMTPQQNQVLSQLLSQLGLGGQGTTGGNFQGANQYLSELLSGDENAYRQFEAPYMRQFNEQTIPGLAERFAGAGAQGGALSSSGFGQALGAAGAGLQENLASLRAGLRGGAATQAQGQYNQQLGLGLGAQPFGYQTRQGSSGLIPNLLGHLGAGLNPGAVSGIGGSMQNLYRSLFG